MCPYVYVVTDDDGFAPNPFHGFCTLATCKPRIRKRAGIGDWVLGIGSPRNNQAGKLIYAMRVEEEMWFDDYWADPRFQQKKPDLNGPDEFRCGDNAYHRCPVSGDWIQERCFHSLEDGSPNPKSTLKDTNPPRVLISEQFAYFGKSAINIPDRILLYGGKVWFKHLRDYQCHFPPAMERYIVGWVEDLTRSPDIHDTPTNWDSTNKSSCVKKPATPSPATPRPRSN